MITSPLLAGTVKEIEKINFPVLVTPKLDGIRVMKIDGKVVTRTFKPLPNRFTRQMLELILPDGIDGEVLLKNTMEFNQVQSQFMRFDGEPDFVFCAFDYVKDDLEKPYADRVNDLSEWYEEFLKNVELIEGTSSPVDILMPIAVYNIDELNHFEEAYVTDGFEGIMLRTPDGKYKCGRSSPKEQILMKLKRFEDSEAEIIGYDEKMHNENEKTVDVFGYSTRAGKKEGMVAANTLGSIQVKDIHTGVEFSLGSGFDDSTRKEIWENQSKYLGQIVKYKFQPSGQKDKPRFPVFLGFRDKLDIIVEQKNAIF